MFKRLIILALFILLSQNSFSQTKDKGEITIPELYEHIAYLASDDLKGRQPGTEGGKLAAEYIRDQIKKSGFKLIAENGFQYFDVIKSIKAGKNNQLSFSSFQGELGKDFKPISFSSNEKISASLIFAGYGFDYDDDSLSWHDYKSIDVSGKWAMILQGDPDSDKRNSRFQQHSSLRKKAMVARDKNTAGLLVVSGEKFNKEDELTKLIYDKSHSDAGIPIIHIKRNVADQMLASTGKTILELEKRLNENLTPASFVVDIKITGETEVVKNITKTQNVVALLEGSDPVLKNEYLVLGAHYDHLGFGGPGSGSRRPDTTAIHNGADDNASGVAAILEMAEKLAANRKNLKRSVLFVAFGAEEMGILGSKYFTDNSLVEIDKIKTMFNLDMVGRMNSESNSLTVGGTGTAIGLSEMVKDFATNLGLNVTQSTEGYGPSDHASFYMKDIPVLFFMTNPHDDYHTPADDIDKINFEGEKKIADYATDLALEIANRTDALVYQEAGPKEQPGTRRSFKVTLGIMPDFTGANKEGLRADAILPGRPAARAGMKKGDIIVAMEGKPVKDIYEYMNRLSDFKVGQRISIKVLRGEEELILIVEL
jgi:aminopeptidase YwaD